MPKARREAPGLATAGSRAGSGILRRSSCSAPIAQGRTGLLQGSAAAGLIHMPMTRTRQARRRP